MNYHCNVTDDSIMSLAIAKAILQSDAQYNRIGSLAGVIYRKMRRE